MRRHSEDAVFQRLWLFFSFFLFLLFFIGRRDEDEVGTVLDEALGLPREQDGPARSGEAQREEAEREGGEVCRGRGRHLFVEFSVFFHLAGFFLAIFYAEGYRVMFRFSGEKGGGKEYEIGRKRVGRSDWIFSPPTPRLINRF